MLYSPIVDALGSQSRVSGRTHLRYLARLIGGVAATSAVVIGLYLTSRQHYLLFHTLAELASIVVATGIFVIAWNARDQMKHDFLLFLGVAYLFVGIIDLMHTLSYQGMGILPAGDHATELWIGARYLEAVSILTAFVFLPKNRGLSAVGLFSGFAFLASALLASVFWWDIFPDCFVPGVGLTPFKRTSEYVISVLLAISAWLLYRNRKRFSRSVYRRVLASLILTIGAELAFTFYIDAYGLSNLIGHYFKLASFILLYQAVISTGIREPHRMIFRELDESNRRLQTEVASRRRVEIENRRMIEELQSALQEIKTLKGIVPICMHCKRIRDDAGYWNQLEEFIRSHSEAEFSHGVCPECMEKYYRNEPAGLKNPDGPDSGKIDEP